MRVGIKKVKQLSGIIWVYIIVLNCEKKYKQFNWLLVHESVYAAEFMWTQRDGDCMDMNYIWLKKTKNIFNSILYPAFRFLMRITLSSKTRVLYFAVEILNSSSFSFIWIMHTLLKSKFVSYLYPETKQTVLVQLWIFFN